MSDGVVSATYIPCIVFNFQQNNVITMADCFNKQPRQLLFLRWSEDTVVHDMPGFGFSKLWQYDPEMLGHNLVGHG